MQSTFDHKSLSSILRSVSDRLLGGLYFILENSRLRYPFTLEGEKHDSGSNETVLLYRIIGKRHVYEISARELCNDRNLINKFHPLDVRTISFIAGVEQVLAEPGEERSGKFSHLKARIFHSE